MASSPGGGDVHWTAGGQTICPSLVRSTSFEPCLTELERMKNSRNSSSNDAQQRLKALSVDQCRLPADSLSTQPATVANSKTSESTAIFALLSHCHSMLHSLVWQFGIVVASFIT